MNQSKHLNKVIKQNAVPGPLLPNAYQQVEWLQSKHNQYWSGSNMMRIFTGVNYFADFEIDTQLTENIGLCAFCGMRNTYNGLVLLNSNNSRYYACYNTSSDYYLTNIPWTERAKICWKNNQVFVNDSYASDFTKVNVTETGSNQGLVLFGSSSAFRSIRIWGFKAWDTNGDLLRNYIPCYRKSDNTPGLYDLVTTQALEPAVILS